MKAFLTAEWKYLLMLNYEIDANILLPYVPAGTELDSWEETTYVSMVGFLFRNTRVKGIAIPFHRHFEEINLRFYVKRQTGNKLKRGVVFIKEIVPKLAIAKIARVLYNENYVAHPMTSNIAYSSTGIPDEVRYGWSVAGKQHHLAGRIQQEAVLLPAEGSEEAYITEHYWGYVSQRNGTTLEYKVEHPQWRVWPVAGAEFSCDVAANYGSVFVDTLSARPKSAFVAEGSAIKVYSGVCI